MPKSTRFPTTVSEIVGRNVRRLRKEKGLTQSQLSTIMKENGYPLDDTQISRIENGPMAHQVALVDADKLVAFSLALGVSLDALVAA